CGPGPPGRPGPAWPGPPGPARLAGAIRVLRVEDRCSGEHRSSTRKTVAEGPDGRTAGRGPPAAAGLARVRAAAPRGQPSQAVSTSPSPTAARAAPITSAIAAAPGSMTPLATSPT